MQRDKHKHENRQTHTQFAYNKGKSRLKRLGAAGNRQMVLQRRASQHASRFGASDTRRRFRIQVLVCQKAPVKPWHPAGVCVCPSASPDISLSLCSDCRVLGGMPHDNGLRRLCRDSTDRSIDRLCLCSLVTKGRRLLVRASRSPVVAQVCACAQVQQE